MTITEKIDVIWRRVRGRDMLRETGIRRIRELVDVTASGAADLLDDEVMPSARYGRRAGGVAHGARGSAMMYRQ